jgi:hypothetical protein
VNVSPILQNFGYPTALAPILRSDGEALLIKTGIEGELQALSLANGWVIHMLPLIPRCREPEYTIHK